MVRPDEWTSGDVHAVRRTRSRRSRARTSSRRPAPPARPAASATTGAGCCAAPRGSSPSRDTGGCSPTASTSSPGCRSCCTCSPPGPRSSRPAPRRPREGLRAMRELGVTHASATPTFWRFVLAEMRADGGTGAGAAADHPRRRGDPRPAARASCEQTFPDARISQVYAATEFGSTGSMRDRRAGLSAEVLDRGDDADVAMKIVDGELWIRSRIGMLGYYGEPPVDADAWRPTGDLVEVDGDRIHFLGRTSEIINVGGVKVHPLTDRGAGQRGPRRRRGPRLRPAQRDDRRRSSPLEVVAVARRRPDGRRGRHPAGLRRSAVRGPSPQHPFRRPDRHGREQDRAGEPPVSSRAAASSSSPAAAAASAPGSCSPTSTPATWSPPARAASPPRSRSGSDPELPDRFLFVPADLVQVRGLRGVRQGGHRQVGPRSTCSSTTPASPATASSGCSPTRTSTPSSTSTSRARIYMTRLVSRRMLAHGTRPHRQHLLDRGPLGLPRARRSTAPPRRRSTGSPAALARELGSRGITRQRDRARLPAHRDEPRPRRGAAPADRAPYAGRPARRARRHRPRRASSSPTRATTTSPARCWSIDGGLTG